MWRWLGPRSCRHCPITSWSENLHKTFPHTFDTFCVFQRGLDEAINNLNKFIYVRVSSHDDYVLNREVILQCSRNRDFFTEFITIEKFVRRYSFSKHKIDGNGFDLLKSGGNFVLFLSVSFQLRRRELRMKA